MCVIFTNKKSGSLLHSIMKFFLFRENALLRNMHSRNRIWFSIICWDVSILRRTTEYFGSKPWFDSQRTVKKQIFVGSPIGNPEMRTKLKNSWKFVYFSAASIYLRFYTFLFKNFKVAFKLKMLYYRTSFCNGASINYVDSAKWQFD